MKRPRDKSYINDPFAPAFSAAFGVFLLWACYNTLENQKISAGRILFAVLLFLGGLLSIVPLGLQIALRMKKRRERTSKAKDETR
jgi:predicted PurR-regulated permease PerM